MAAIELLNAHPERREEKLRDNATYFREQIIEAGFKPLPAKRPIVPISWGRRPPPSK